MNDVRDTVDPPMKDNMGPKLGTDCATKRTKTRTMPLQKILLKPNSLGALNIFSTPWKTGFNIMVNAVSR